MHDSHGKINSVTIEATLGFPPNRSVGAIDTFFGHRVDCQPTIGNFGVTFGAIAVITVLDASLRHFNAKEITLPLAFLSLGHGLLLHRIHAREPADSLLIEFDGCPGIFRKLRDLLKLAASQAQPFSCNLKINCHVATIEPFRVK